MVTLTVGVLGALGVILAAILGSANLINADGQCEKGFLPCNDGSCILQQHWCDGIFNCPNNEDEAKDCRPKNAFWLDFKDSVFNCMNDVRAYKGLVSLEQVGTVTSGGNSSRCDATAYPDSCDCYKDGGTLMLVCKWEGKDLPALLNMPSELTKIEFMNKPPWRKHFINSTNRHGVYAHIPNLMHLNFASISVMAIAPFAFNGYVLNLLDLSENHLSWKTLKPNTFYGLKVCNLIIEKSDIRDFPPEVFSKGSAITWLNLAYNHIRMDNNGMFQNLQNTSGLELAWNDIDWIRNGSFAGLSNLHYLDLAHNPIDLIEVGSFDELTSMHTLYLQETDITKLPEDLFAKTRELRHLELQDNKGLTTLPPNIFRNFNCSLLNLKGVIIENISEEMFTDLPETCNLIFEKLLYCFYAHHIRNCTPKHDGISSFDQLLVSPHLVILAWICAFFTVAGNLAIFSTRWYLDRALSNGVHAMVIREARVMSLFIKHLSFSDFLTGVYLLCICCYNELFKGQYSRHAIQWINSVRCKALGVVAMSSAEISMMILTFIALDRFMTIVYGLSKPKLSIDVIRTVLVTIWLIGFAIAVIPAVLWSDRTHNYYGNNGVCLPLYLQEPHLKGWIYSLAVVIGLNGFLILIIIFSYAGIFFWIRKWRKDAPIGSEERELLWRFFILVFLNLCCWLPTFVFKILAVTKYVLPNDSYAWIVTFVFPLNSAMNPIAYSLSSSEFRSRVARATGCHQIYMLIVKRLHLIRRRLSAPFTTCSLADSYPADGDNPAIPAGLDYSPATSLCRRLKDKCRNSLVSQSLPPSLAPHNLRHSRRNESLGQATSPFAQELVPLNTVHHRQASF